jgi:hypothetical protein
VKVFEIIDAKGNRVAEITAIDVRFVQKGVGFQPGGDEMSKFHDMGQQEGEHWVAFHCPGCEHGHSIPVSGRRAWQWNGSYDSPTITPSLLVNKGGANPTAPVCHSHVTAGNIQFLNDCTHKLAGQTVQIPDFDE